VLELGLGAALLVLALVLWLARKRVASHVAAGQGRGDRSSFLVGAGIMAAELPTAFPYFAAVAAIVASGKSVPKQISVLALYNLVFLAPLLGILGVRLLAGDRGERWLGRLRGGLDQWLAVLLPGLVLVAAVVLIVVGTVGVTTD
jgi:cytochrome c biogenesis protein CcdA